MIITKLTTTISKEGKDMVVSKEPIENSIDDKSFWVGISDSHDTIQYMS